jgi:hypothetical protein
VNAPRFGVARLARFGLLIPAALALVNAGLPHLFATTLIATRSANGAPSVVAISVAVLLPIGLLLGRFFPLGMLRFGDGAKAWFWAMNGACGVLASVCSLALAITFGFAAVAWVGVAGYAVAVLLLRGRSTA